MTMLQHAAGAEGSGSPAGGGDHTPRLSVVLSYFNLEKYLSEAIWSIRNQTFTDFELLLLDDGSTDACPSIAADHARLDSRIRVIRVEKNGGISANVNRGLGEARAEWVALMDGDDVAHPDKLMRQVAYLAVHPDVICVGCFPLMVDEKRHPIGVLDIYRESHEDIERILLEGHGWAFLPPTALMRRSFALEVGGYREDLVTSMDLDFFLKLCELGKIANVPEVLFEYRLRAKSITHARKAGQVDRHNAVLKEAYARRGLQRPVPLSSVANDGLTAADHHLKWGWWALSCGYPETGRRQGIMATFLRPWSLSCWRLLACAQRDVWRIHGGTKAAGTNSR